MMELKNNNYESWLKERFIILHDYAHLMFLTDEKIKQCVNEGIYSLSEMECLKCNMKIECEYLNDKQTENIMKNNLETIVEDMEIAKKFVKCHSIHNIQNDGSCDCDSCSWLHEFTRTQAESLELMKAKLIEVTA